MLIEIICMYKKNRLCFYDIIFGDKKIKIYDRC